MENTSGQGALANVPAEIDRWNWGAFLLNWIWGIGNNTFIALLVFVPFVGFVMLFVLGAKGSSWAWRNKRWESIEHFKATQRKWARWGAIAFVAFIALFIALFFVIAASMKSSDAFQLSLSRLQASPEGVQQIGRPVETGFPMGSMQVSGPRGNASLSYSVSGPNGKGTVFVEATKDMGQWKIDRLVLEQEGTGRRTEINQ